MFLEMRVQWRFVMGLPSNSSGEHHRYEICQIGGIYQPNRAREKSPERKRFGIEVEFRSDITPYGRDRCSGGHKNLGRESQQGGIRVSDVKQICYRESEKHKVDRLEIVLVGLEIRNSVSA